MVLKTEMKDWLWNRASVLTVAIGEAEEVERSIERGATPWFKRSNMMQTLALDVENAEQIIPAYPIPSWKRFNHTAITTHRQPDHPQPSSIGSVTVFPTAKAATGSSTSRCQQGRAGPSRPRPPRSPTGQTTGGRRPSSFPTAEPPEPVLNGVRKGGRKATSPKRPCDAFMVRD